MANFLTYHSSSSASIMTNRPVMWKRIAKVPTQKVTRRPKYFLFSSSSSDALFKIAWLFHNGFYTNQQHFTLNRAPPHCFFTILKSHKALQTGQRRTLASFAKPLYWLVHMHTKHLELSSLLQSPSLSRPKINWTKSLNIVMALP